jgi:hypothetical protein
MRGASGGLVVVRKRLPAGFAAVDVAGYQITGEQGDEGDGDDGS